MLRLALIFLMDLMALFVMIPQNSVAEVGTGPAAAPLVGKLTYAESYNDKLVRSCEEGDCWYDVISTGSFTFSASLPAANYNIAMADINAATEFGVQIGSYGDVFSPGEDPKYVPGASTSAKIIRQQEDWDGKAITYLTATISWTTQNTKITAVNITLTGLTPDYIEPPLAYDYMGSIGAFTDTISAVFGIGAFNQAYSVGLKGTTSLKTVTADEEPYDLYTVSIQGTGAAAPVAFFTANPDSGPAPLTVQFTDTSTGSITNYDWDFGDGTKSTDTNPSHTYKIPGTYLVTLTVAGLDFSSSKTATVNVADAPPVAHFVPSPPRGREPLTVQFTDASTGTIASYSWSFGDGGSSTERDPGYTYFNPGKYTVTLTVSGPKGSSSTSGLIIVGSNETKPGINLLLLE
jgi:PKD repeat protein